MYTGNYILVVSKFESYRINEIPNTYNNLLQNILHTIVRYIKMSGIFSTFVS